MIKTVKSFLLVGLFVLGTTASAAVITINDGDFFVPDLSSSDTYQFAGGISRDNPIYTFGVKLGLNELFDISIAAPSFNLISLITTEPDGAGTAIGTPPGGMLQIAAGDIWDVTVNGNSFAGDIWWFYITTFDANLDIIDSDFGGTLKLSDTLSGANISEPDPGDPGNPTDPGGPNGPVSVTAPGASYLMVIGLLLLGLRLIKGKCPSTLRKNK
jgi:hypothetical protein